MFHRFQGCLIFWHLEGFLERHSEVKRIFGNLRDFEYGLPWMTEAQGI